MSKHASEYQCEFRGALCLLVFEGKLRPKFKGYKVKVRSYNGFIRTWNFRNKDGSRMKNELKQLDTVFTRQCKWMDGTRKTSSN